jgi:hypothetical protein
MPSVRLTKAAASPLPSEKLNRGSWIGFSTLPRT